MKERIHPTRKENNAEGADVPPAQQIDPSLPERQYATTPQEIPTQPGGEETLEHPPSADSESTIVETKGKTSRAKRMLGAFTALLALTLGAGVGAGMKTGAIKLTPGNEAVATSSPFTSTTTPEAVVPPPRHETTGATTTTATETPKSERIYTLTGEATSLAKLKEEGLTITTAEAPTPRDVAANHIGPMLSEVANFGVYRLNQGLHNLYINPKTGERGLAAYNKDQLLNTDLLDPTGLKAAKKRANEITLLDILVERNKHNSNNNQFTKAILSDTDPDESAPAMNGKKTAIIDAKLTLKQMTQDSDYEPKDGETYRLQFYATTDVANPNNWVLGSYSIRK